MDLVLRLRRSKDRFPKITHFIPYLKVVRLRGLPKTIVLNMKSKFLSYFWRILWNKLATKLFFSTTCHPKTNGQTVVVNRTLSQLLRVVNITISYSSFELAYRFNPSSPLDFLPLPNMSFRLSEERLFKAQFVKKLHEKVQSHIKKSTQAPILRSNSLQEMEYEMKMDKHVKDTQEGLKTMETIHFKAL
ncbi:hypothetical protein CR513_14132, partial [Mucuna pruriens]